MSEPQVKLQDVNTKEEAKKEQGKPVDLVEWEKPTMEDVSEQVMAQPYIRFT
jgi:hypothetical protein